MILWPLLSAPRKKAPGVGKWAGGKEGLVSHLVVGLDELLPLESPSLLLYSGRPEVGDLASEEADWAGDGFAGGLEEVDLLSSITTASISWTSQVAGTSSNGKGTRLEVARRVRGC